MAGNHGVHDLLGDVLGGGKGAGVTVKVDKHGKLFLRCLLLQYFPDTMEIALLVVGVINWRRVAIPEPHHVLGFPVSTLT